jgi:signal recognition particle receptor subunit alpha
MLESLTIFNKGGLILYQHLLDDGSSSSTGDLLNMFLEEVYLNPTKSLQERKASLDSHPTKVLLEWEESSNLLAVAIYPDIKQQGFPWIRSLVESSLQEYQIFADSQQLENSSAPANDAEDLFDKTFQALMQHHKKNASNISKSTSSNSVNKQSTITSPKTNSGKGKEKRNWHDGKAKVTKEAMAELDRSKETGESDQDGTDRALAEARAAYLPSDADLADFAMQPQIQIDDAAEESESSWGNSLKGLFQQVTGNKVLTQQDLEAPLKEMGRMLTSKNVASDIADQIVEKVGQQLVGKKLNSMFRVKTAVRQALESVLNKLLAPSTQLDLLRQVVSKRDSWTSKRPYVIVVVGINGVGKSTSLAKLAYYLKSNGCKPLLAACDTFRSGAVEQLSVHAKCLELPIYSKGYAKDPSSVATAAIEQAIQDKNDVVLVDTAGRMQNNVPLMKALGKLAHENQPDMIVFVGEALVGNDGVDQVRMFHQAVSTYDRKNKIDAILLTKFDTVSDMGK